MIGGRGMKPARLVGRVGSDPLGGFSHPVRDPGPKLSLRGQMALRRGKGHSQGPKEF